MIPAMGFPPWLIPVMLAPMSPIAAIAYVFAVLYGVAIVVFALDEGLPDWVVLVGLFTGAVGYVWYRGSKVGDDE